MGIPERPSGEFEVPSVASLPALLLDQLRRRDVVGGLKNCHHHGLYSLVLDKQEDGSLRRIFATDWMHSMDKLFTNRGHFTIGPHNHDKALSFTLLYGMAWNVGLTLQPWWQQGDCLLFKYPFVSGLETGNFQLGPPVKAIASMEIQPLDGKRLISSDIHTVLVPVRLAAWLVEEGPVEDVQKFIYSLRDDLKLDITGLYQPMSPQDIGALCDAIINGIKTHNEL